jgi:hypothetical protein
LEISFLFINVLVKGGLSNIKSSQEIHPFEFPKRLSSLMRRFQYSYQTPRSLRY